MKSRRVLQDHLKQLSPQSAQVLFEMADHGIKPDQILTEVRKSLKTPKMSPEELGPRLELLLARKDWASWENMDVLRKLMATTSQERRNTLRQTLLRNIRAEKITYILFNSAFSNDSNTRSLVRDIVNSAAKVDSAEDPLYRLSHWANALKNAIDLRDKDTANCVRAFFTDVILPRRK